MTNPSTAFNLKPVDPHLSSGFGNIITRRLISGLHMSGKAPADDDYIRVQILELETELQRLNILDHPIRIIEICNQISKLRKDLGEDGD